MVFKKSAVSDATTQLNYVFLQANILCAVMKSLFITVVLTVLYEIYTIPFIKQFEKNS